VHGFLTNPGYAGAFVYGRQRQVKRVDEHGEVRVGRVDVPIEEWSVCLPDHHPGYVSWDEYLATRKRLRANVTPRGEGGGAAREGGALLQGLVRCGRKMQIAYSGTGGKVRRYACSRGRDWHATGKACQTGGGARLDKTVTSAFLEAAAPAGLAATAGAIRELEDQHEQRLAGQRLAVERAQYEADRAQRKYDACEPENRLVARTLERALEAAFVDLERERGKLAQLDRARPMALTDHEREALTQLARELPRLWAAETTADRDRKQLLRTLIGEVIVTADHEVRRAAVEVAVARRRSDRAQLRAEGAREAGAGPGRRGHAGADPPSRGASLRPGDRGDPQPPRPTDRHRPAVHQGTRPRDPQTRRYPSRPTPGPGQ